MTGFLWPKMCILVCYATCKVLNQDTIPIRHNWLPTQPSWPLYDMKSLNSQKTVWAVRIDTVTLKQKNLMSKRPGFYIVLYIRFLFTTLSLC